MKQLLLLTLGLAAMTSPVTAQSGYDFSYKTKQAYTPLTAGTAVFRSTDTWMNQQAGIPLGFPAHIGSTGIDHFYVLSNAMMPATDTIGVLSGFIPLFGVQLWDKNAGDPDLSSPVRYVTEGTSPSRIFKLEYFNAGLSAPGINNDSVNFQVWLYEISDIVEFRYGDYQMSDDYFGGGEGPVIGFLKNYDPDKRTFEKLYCLRGDPDAPAEDSTKDFSIRIHGMPKPGTVYRFTPHVDGTSVGEKELLTQFRVYPTRTSDVLQIENNKGVQANAEVFNINGQSVLGSTAMTAGRNTISVSNLASGTYILQLRTDQGPAIYLFVKE